MKKKACGNNPAPSNLHLLRNLFFLASQAGEVQQIAATVQARSIPSQVRPNFLPTLTLTLTLITSYWNLLTLS